MANLISLSMWKPGFTVVLAMVVGIGVVFFVVILMIDMYVIVFI